jgi:hypothetical protein
MEPRKRKYMKLIKILGVGVVALSVVCLPISGKAAEEKQDSKDSKVKPYTLTTCVVSNEKLGEMGKPYVFTHEGREIKLCCKDCLTDFKKDPAKYVKKIEAAEAKAKDKKS